MEPYILYAKTPDGVNITYATQGNGHPFVYVLPAPVDKVEAEWQIPMCRPWYENSLTPWRIVTLGWPGGDDSGSTVVRQ